MTSLSDQQYIEGYQAGVEYCRVFRPSLAIAAIQSPLPGMSYDAAKGWLDALKDYITMFERVK